jgi:hypothetical protein
MFHMRKGRGKEEWVKVCDFGVTVPIAQSWEKPNRGRTPPKESYVEFFSGFAHGQAPAHSLELVEKISRDRLFASYL